jgi:hypothetical protein
LSCQPSRTPEGACEHLLRAISEGDASAVFDALMPPTQWSFDTVVKNHRRMRELILASYPAELQAAALGRLYGAEASSGRDLFGRTYPERYEKDFSRRLGSGPMQLGPAPSSDSGAPRRLCARQGGQPFVLQAAAGKWGLVELDREWDEAQLRTFHDVATVQKNAELYQGVRPATK